MKANELRIGNYVIPPETPFEPIKSTLDGLCYYKDDFLPIPLTEQWLLKFGFKKTRSDFYKAASNYITICVDFYLKSVFLEVYDSNTELDIKYVHQLQNLYFALTGEEL